MATNRYSRISTSSFDPLSFQELLAVPMYKQNLHDQVLGKADEISSIDINYLDQDAGLVDKFRSQYDKELEGLTDDILQKGVSGRSKSRVSSLAKQRQKWMDEGEGFDIQQNYNRYMKNREDLEKMYQSGNISLDKYQLGLNQALQSYRGVENKDTYSPFNAVLDTEYDEKAREIARDISNNPHKITSLSGLQYDPRTGKYVDYTTKKEYTEEGAIKQAVQAGLMMDPAIMADLRQREQLGMLGTSPEQFISNLGSINEFIFRKNNVDRNRSFVGMDHTQLDSQDIGDGNQYEFGPAKTFDTQIKSLNNHLSKILEGKNVGGMGIPQYVNDENGNPVNDQWGNPLLKESGVPATYQNIPAQEQKEYDAIYQGLIRSGKLSSSIQKDSPEAISTVKNYLDNRQGVTYQDVKYTEGLVRDYSGRAKKFRQTNASDLAKGIALNGNDRVFIDMKKGKRVDFDDLSTEQKEQMLTGKAQVAATYSPRNMMADELVSAGEIDDRVFVAGHEVVFPDGSRYYVSRSESEMRSPSYVADQYMNRMYRDFTKYPDIPHTYNIPGLGKIQVISDLNNGSIRVIEEDGDVTTYSNSGEFEFHFDRALGMQ